MHAFFGYIFVVVSCASAILLLRRADRNAVGTAAAALIAGMAAAMTGLLAARTMSEIAPPAGVHQLLGILALLAQGIATAIGVAMFARLIGRSETPVPRLPIAAACSAAAAILGILAAL